MAGDSSTQDVASEAAPTYLDSVRVLSGILQLIVVMGGRYLRHSLIMQHYAAVTKGKTN